jgi:hypothetical protein
MIRARRNPMSRGWWLAAVAAAAGVVVGAVALASGKPAAAAGGSTKGGKPGGRKGVPPPIKLYCPDGTQVPIEGPSHCPRLIVLGGPEAFITTARGVTLTVRLPKGSAGWGGAPFLPPGWTVQTPPSQYDDLKLTVGDPGDVVVYWNTNNPTSTVIHVKE